MASTIRTDLPKDSDSAHASKSRLNFRRAANDINELQLLSGIGGEKAVTGNASQAIVLTADYSTYLLTTSGGGTNDFDLEDGSHGQLLTIVFSSGAQSATVTEANGTTIVAADNSGVASITLTSGDFVVLQFLRNRWVVLFNNGAVVA